MLRISIERRMIRMMCGVSLRDMVKSEELASRLGVVSMEEHLSEEVEMVRACDEKGE